MKIKLQVLGFTMLLVISATAIVPSPVPRSRHLRPDEYDVAALIYNSELEALGERALYPICIALPSGVPTKPLIKYLRANGYPISVPALCEPAMSSRHPRDYSHGLRIFIDDPQDGQSGQFSVKVESGDLTVRPGQDLATLLRRGIYNLKRNESGEWKIVAYTKEYDSDDAKRDCDAGKRDLSGR